MTAQTIVARRPRHQNPLGDGDERYLDVIPLANMKQLGRVGRYVYAEHGEGEHGEGELKINTGRYYEDSSTDADVIVAEEVAAEGGTKFRLAGGGHVDPPSVRVLHEGSYVAQGTYAQERDAALRRESPPPPPVTPVHLGPHVDRVREQLEREGVTYRNHGGRLLITSERGRIFDTTLALARQYAPLLLDPKTTCACGKTAEYMAEVDVPLCPADATRAY